MVGSVWSGHNPYDDLSLYGADGKRAQGAQEEQAKDKRESASKASEFRNWGALPADGDGSFSPWLSSDSVRAVQVAAQISSDEKTLSAGGEEEGSALPAGGGAPAAGGAGDDDDDETITIYKTVVLPDGSKILQIITKKPDGTTSTTTTKLPGLGKLGREHGDSEKKVVETMPDDDGNTGRQKDQAGAAAMDILARSAGLQED